MGNRASIIIESENFASPIYLYGHWAGEDNFRAVQKVLERTDRIGDASYLTAQLFYAFSVEMNAYDGTTGFGIGAYTNDYTTLTMWEDNPYVLVNADTGAVTYEGTTYEPTELGMVHLHE